MPNPTPSISLQDIYTQVIAFLQPLLPAGVVIVQGFPNRTAMPPSAPGFVMMNLSRNRRLRTNIDTWDTTNPAPTVESSEQGIELRLQLDCYGADSGDWATVISTLWRDQYGTAANEPTFDPLYCEDPIRAPLVTGEDQYEDRWTVGAILQYNPVVSVSQDFMSEATVGLVNVDEKYPP